MLSFQSQLGNTLNPGHLPLSQPSSSQMISSQLFSSKVAAIASLSSTKPDLDIVLKSPSPFSESTETSNTETNAGVGKTFIKPDFDDDKTVIKHDSECNRTVIEQDPDCCKSVIKDSDASKTVMEQHPNSVYTVKKQDSDHTETVIKQDSDVVMVVNNGIDKAIDNTVKSLGNVSHIVKHGLSSPVKAITEAVAPVSSKCLSKAMKPPVTIKNFFKKVEVNVTKRDITQETLNEMEQCASAKLKNPDKKVSEMSYEEFLGKKNKSGNGTKPTVKTTESRQSASNVEIDEKLFTSKEENRAALKMSSSKPSVTGSRKRANESESYQPMKKAKQATLFSTFQKMTSKKEENEKKSATCPICGKEFEKGISNVELNKHVDNCIIE